MRFATIGALLLMLAGCALLPGQRSLPQFPWGASPQEIRAEQATRPVLATPERQVYHARLAGLPATFVYHFADGKLTEVVVVNRARYQDRTRYIDDFHHVSGLLRQRHGQPDFEEMRWRNRLFADRPERYGDAISAGHLTYLARWTTPEVRILMALRGERYQVVHELVYRPPENGG